RKHPDQLSPPPARGRGWRADDARSHRGACRGVMLVVPSVDLQNGRSRLVWWPGAASGTGSPTDRPERIAQSFVAQGASLLHLVDLDGAARGRPVNLDAITAVARSVAVPLQVAGGVDGPEQVELCFAAGATRVVVPLWAAADDPAPLRSMLAIA